MLNSDKTENKTLPLTWNSNNCNVQCFIIVFKSKRDDECMKLKSVISLKHQINEGLTISFWCCPTFNQLGNLFHAKGWLQDFGGPEPDFI